MKLIARALLDELAAKARASPRARAHHTIHAGPEDPVQRFIVYAEPHSYFRPHRHLNRSELAFVVSGSFEVATFQEDGRLQARYSVGAGSESLAYETPAGTWHTVLPGPVGGAFLEIKQGPYDPATAAEFASWAPAEGDPAAARFLAWVRGAQPGESVPPEVSCRAPRLAP